MTVQPKALRMADALDEYDWRGAAAELRRLHNLNAELRRGTEEIIAVTGYDYNKARAAIAKAEGEMT